MRHVAGAEIERDRHDAVGGHRLMAQALGGAVAQTPGAAMALHQRRERPLPARLEHAREQRFLGVAEVLDVVHVEFMGGLGFEGGSGHGRVPLTNASLPIIAHRAAADNRQ